MRILVPALAALTLIIPALSTPALAADEAKAKEAAVALLKAVKAKDIDSVMKLVDVPFVYRQEDGDKKIATHKDKAALKEWLSARLEDIKDVDKVPSKVDEMLTLDALKEKIKDADERALAEEVLGKDGYLAVVTTGDDKKAGIAVGTRDGKAMIVGLIVR